MAHSSVVEYEAVSAGALGVGHVVAFGFARHALAAALAASGLRSGDHVILSPLTCRVVPLVLLSLKLHPVYADISAETLNLDPRQVERRIERATAAVLFQHTYGSDTGVAAIAELTSRHRRLLFEDCAQCLPCANGAYAPGRHGIAAVFSNNLMKPLPAGSGGLVSTDDSDLAARLVHQRDALPLPHWRRRAFARAERLAQHYLLRPASYWRLFDWQRRVNPSYRERPLDVELRDEIEACRYQPGRAEARFGLRALDGIGVLAQVRRAACEDYARRLADLHSATLRCVTLPTATPLYYYPVLTEHKPAVLAAARRRQLPVVPWPLSTPIYPLERMEALRAYGYQPGHCPVAEDVARRLVGLPTGIGIGTRHRERLVRLLAEVSST